MIEASDIRSILKATGWKQGELGQRTGVTQATVSRWLKGSVPDTLQQEKLGTLMQELGLVEGSEDDGIHVVGVVGTVSAGNSIESASAQLPEAEPLFEIEVPFAVPVDAFALEIKGESMWPRYDDGDVIICYRHSQDPAPLVGWEAAVGTHEGNRYLKRITKGSRSGLYNLESHNAAPIRDQQISWASEVYGVVRAARWRRLDEPGRRREIRKAVA